MAKVIAQTKTELAIHQKIAVSFIIGTATMVLLSVILAGVITLTLHQPATTSLPIQDSDRIFST